MPASTCATIPIFIVVIYKHPHFIFHFHFLISICVLPHYQSLSSSLN
ncbi:hypothetical protein bcere0021_28280 [Bacillus cereus Rock3-42]|nr:hypothetical protein bcere0021_28280 [Bacillus cereus Rock3-42]